MLVIPSCRWTQLAGLPFWQLRSIPLCSRVIHLTCSGWSHNIRNTECCFLRVATFKCCSARGIKAFTSFCTQVIVSEGEILGIAGPEGVGTCHLSSYWDLSYAGVVPASFLMIKVREGQFPHSLASMGVMKLFDLCQSDGLKMISQYNYHIHFPYETAYILLGQRTTCLSFSVNLRFISFAICCSIFLIDSFQELFTYCGHAP